MTVLEALFSGIAFLLVNFAMFSYFYGRLSRTVEIDNERITELEVDVKRHEHRITRIESGHAARGIDL